MVSRRAAPVMPAAVPQMNADTRDELILTLRRQGLTFKQIARRVGLSERGVSMAMRRIQAGRPGRVRAP
jgi:DNA-binding NarL/FixJ family response regulator